MKIKQTCIDKILENATVVDILGHYLELKKQGANYAACSPFNSEKTPSLIISPSKGIWKDFSSGKGGYALKFIMEFKNMDFIEAVKEAARICSIEIEYEEISEENKKQYEEYLKKRQLIEKVSDKYRYQLEKADDNHWVKKMIAERKWTEETISIFELGYAPASRNFITKAIIEKGNFSLAKEIGIVSTDFRTGVSYDFFIDRIIFPIQDIHGKTIAFGGRRSNHQEVEKYAKFINSPTSSIYSKENALFGLFQSKIEIRKQNRVILVEGYADVISVYQSGLPIVIATCGTGLSGEQAKIIRKLCSHVIIWRDSDTAGHKAAIRDLSILLKHNFRVSHISGQEGSDPDEISRTIDNLPEWFENNIQDALEWISETYKFDGLNPDEKSTAIQELCDLLSYIPEEIKREEYIKIVSKTIKQKAAIIKKIVSEKLTKIAPKERTERTENFLNTLPYGADKDQYLKDRFCEIGNCYWFYGKDGFFTGTNFIIKALYHIKGITDNRRLCEVTNDSGRKNLIDFESKDFVNFSKIQETLVNIGVYYFEGGVSTNHFKLLTKKVLNEFQTAKELKTLGWQKEGFFAYANGVYFQSRFHKINKYGIVNLEDLEHEESEYIEKVTNFYLPAFSEIYKNSDDDDDPYENDRYFVYKVAPVTLEQWMQQIVTVYGDKGIIGIAFVFASIFRDIIMKGYSSFPLLGLFGEKESGKSELANSIFHFFFTEDLKAFDFNNGTPVGFFRRLARVKNAITFLDEYTNNISETLFQAMKGAWGGLGREKGIATSDNRTSTTRVNSSIVYAGQYLPIRDDNGLLSRTIPLQYIKKEFTIEEKEEYLKLKSWEKKGLNSLVLDILKYRPYVETRLYTEYNIQLSKMKKELEGVEVQERMTNNLLALIIPVKLLWDNFQFPFEYDYFYKLCKETIIESSTLLVESEGSSEFWAVFEYLCEVNILVENKDYKIDIPQTVKRKVKQDGKNVTEEWKNLSGDRILYVYFKKVYQDIHREMARRGSEMINEATIKNYFRAKKYFIGGSVTVNIGGKSPSCCAFNYTQLHNQGILNIDKDIESSLFTCRRNEDDEYKPPF